jgi:hypothetical protein
MGRMSLSLVPLLYESKLRDRQCPCLSFDEHCLSFLGGGFSNLEWLPALSYFGTIPIGLPHTTFPYVCISQRCRAGSYRLEFGLLSVFITLLINFISSTCHCFHCGNVRFPPPCISLLLDVAGIHFYPLILLTLVVCITFVDSLRFSCLP